MPLVSALGLLVFMGVAWAFGTQRRIVNPRVLGWGIGLQLLMGALVFRTDVGYAGLLVVNDTVNALLAAAAEGPLFLVGALGDPAATGKAGLGFILLFQGLLSIIVISALMQLLYHFGVMGVVVRLFARAFSRLMRISGAEAVAASANLFVGNESILAVRPFLARMTRSELCVLMTACMATVSANMMGVYVSMLGGTFPGIAGHLASATLLSAPASLVMAKLLCPETETPETLGRDVRPSVERSDNAIAAVMDGAEAGGTLIKGIALLVVAAVGLLGVANLLVGWLGEGVHALAGGEGRWTIARGCGVLFRPAAWLMGVPWDEAGPVGELLGLRMVATEVAGYGQLAEWMRTGAISPRSATITAYALCGFAHLPAVAITTGGLAALVPERRGDLSRLAMRALAAATLACLMTGAIAGLFARTDGALLLEG